MVPYIIEIEQAFFGGVFKRDVLIPVLKDLKTHNIPSSIYKFIHLLIRECSHSTISSFEELYKELGFDNVSQYREFLNLMLSYGRRVREYKQAETNAKVNETHFDLQYLAENYLDYLDELKVS
jgi:hypothetical protein